MSGCRDWVLPRRWSRYRACSNRSTADRAAALKRHLVFFNSEPQFGALVPAAVIAMEEQRAAGAGIPDEAINGVKSGLMGPWLALAIR